MDLSDATKILLDRIQKLEPEIATKIMGCILIQDHGEREMIRLACAPEKHLENLVYKTKLQLGYLSKPPVSTSMSPPISINSTPISEVPLNYMAFSPNGTRPYSCPATFRVPPGPFWDTQLTPEQQPALGSDLGSFGYVDSVAEDNYRLQNQAQFVGFEDQFDPITPGGGGFSRDLYYPDAALGNLNMRASRRSPSLPDFPLKTCHYFNKGFCKHGNSCRYLHGHDNFSPMFGPNELGAEDHMFSPGSLEKLELEITELLKSRRGNPVSIASLPMYYYEKYGKTLQAEGYLTESQRHGRAGYSLTKLLARLKSIRLIDRPHGQHSVILAEDASKYNLENRSERNDPGPIVSGSRQIYLTFPAESTFTEEDVSGYFSTFGTVEDVRIPCQQKRMFGFVTFASANTVRTVLAKGNPHFVCGSRVLVKPYREKSKLNERKYLEKSDHVPRCEAPRFLRRQLMEEQEQIEQALEMERRRLSELQLRFKHVHNQQYIDYCMEELNASEDPSKFRTAEHFDYLLGIFNSSSINDNKLKHSGPDFTDQDSQGINLPESPFATAIGSGISAVI